QKRQFIPWKAYCGSLNYTMNAFYKRRESVSQCDSHSALLYYEELLKDAIDCAEPNITKQLRNVVNNNAGDFDEPDDSESAYKLYDKQVPIGTLNVSLLKSDGSDTGYGSGINWGIRPNGTKRNMNQAYIPYNRKDKEAGFFPDREKPDDENCPMFRVITKDFGSFHMRMAQQGNKAIHSVESNAILGEWIRQKIGAAPGGYVTKKMLEKYGRTYVTFRKYPGGIYLLDF
ncbi:MAG: NgoFVII family restriction endonuclease, partial [Thermoguttaceae bacterium]|nr:NgoFVII family restriction endonuclease [Thermoguttaceae bacterium]